MTPTATGQDRMRAHRAKKAAANSPQKEADEAWSSAVVPSSSAEQSLVIEAPMDDVVESPTNPRITFKNLPELAESIKLVGVLQPGLARPVPEGRPGRFELVFAARRFRAAKLAGLKTFPLRVRVLTDEQVLEIQLAENNDRDDVHPLEEADGYRRGIDTHGWTIEDLASKAHRPISTVRQRLQYCTLIPAAREAFLDGRLTSATALIVARIPDPGVQAKALKEIVEYGGDRDEKAPTSKADASWIVRTKFMLRLVDAPFDRKDGKLVAGAPACAECPKRTGKQRDLFEDVEAKEDLCLDVTCFGAKKNAAWEKKRGAAEAKGQEVLSDSTSKKLFFGQTLRSDSDYVDLHGTHYEGGVGKGVKLKTLLPKNADVTVVIARDEEGNARELVEKTVFAKLAPKSGIKPPQKKRSPTSLEKSFEREREKQDREHAALREEARALGAKAEAKEPTEAFWRVVASCVVPFVDDHHDVAASVGVEVPPKKKGFFDDGARKAVEKKIFEKIASMKAARARGLIVEMLALSTAFGAKDCLATLRSLYGTKTAKKKTAKR